MTPDTDHIATALAAVADTADPVTIQDIIALVDELAIASSPTPRSTITRPALLTMLRDAVAPNLGSTGAGRGAGRSIPIDAGALTLWEDVTGRIEALHEDLEGEAPVTGSHEQILLAWSRELLAAANSPHGLNQDAIDYAHHRVARIRNLIRDHFDPPRIGEILGAACLDCGETQVLLLIDGEEIPAPAVITIRRGNDPLIVHCRVCAETWSTEDLELLDRFRWAQRRTERIHDLTTPLNDDDWHHIRLELRDNAAPKNRNHA